jgi:hypothetical protein
VGRGDVPRSEDHLCMCVWCIWTDCPIGQPMGQVDAQLMMLVTVSSDVYGLMMMMMISRVGNERSLPVYVDCMFWAKVTVNYEERG